MHPAIRVVEETARGCGYRHPGAYLRGGGMGHSCLKLPIPLMASVEGFTMTPSRSWSEIIPYYFLTSTERHCGELSHLAACEICPANVQNSLQRAILNWVGDAYYDKDAIIDESREIGLDGRQRGFSRRVNWETIPDWVAVGKTWVFQAHRAGMTWEEVVFWQQRRGVDVSVFSASDSYPNGYKPKDWIPAIFHAFLLQEVEYVVTGDEPDDYIEALVNRGFTPVKVIAVDKSGQPVSQEELAHLTDDNEKRIAKIKRQEDRAAEKEKKKAEKTRKADKPKTVTSQLKLL